MYNKEYMSYLPEYLCRIREIKAIGEAVDNLISVVEEMNDKVLEESLILTARGQGIKMWEEIFSLRSIGTVEERRNMVLSMFTDGVPITLRKLQEILNMICGNRKVRAEYGTEPYTAVITVSPSAWIYKKAVEELVKRVMPANIAYEIVPAYNTHRDLGAKTHAQLGGYRHIQLNGEEL